MRWFDGIEGIWKDGEMPRLGDMVESLAKPIAKALRMPCLDKDGKLKPESGCAKRRDALNKLSS